MGARIAILKNFSAAAALLFILAISPTVFAQSVQINVTDNSFSQEEVRIPVGGSIRWMNTGSMDHTIMFETEDVFDSGNLAPGFSTSHTFTVPGTYRYYCRYHGAPGGQGMSGTIIVTNAAGASSASSTIATSSIATSTFQLTKHPQVPNTGGQTYVSLRNVPYTGFDLGPAGNALYALLMSIFFLSLGYLTFYCARTFYTKDLPAD